MVPFRVAAIAVLVALSLGCDRNEPSPKTETDLRSEKIEQTATPSGPDATEQDLTSIQGKWELVSLKRDGVEAEKNPCSYVFEEATMTVTPKDRQPSFYTLKLDASKSPREMDIIATWEDGRVTKAEVIYELEGDTFRWCHVNGKRPRAFLSESNPDGTSTVVRRVPAQ